jgi:hypothetical protein
MAKFFSTINLTEGQITNHQSISHSVSVYSMQQQIFTFLPHNIHEIVLQTTIWKITVVKSSKFYHFSFV